MLFFLDNDVDVAVARVIRQANHHCITARDVAMTDANDEAISIWGHEHKAVVVTHDKAMIQLRKKNTYGLHIWLECHDIEASEVIAKQLPEIITALNGRDAVVLRVTKSQVVYHAGQWR